MHTVATETETIPEDLLAMPDGKSFELVDGQLVKRHVSALSSWVGGEIMFRLRVFLEANPAGLLWGTDNGYQCFPDAPRKVRRADVAFVRNDRLPADWQAHGFLHVAPDLAVEVISPHESAEDLEEKIDDYLAAGVSIVWVVYPDLRKLRIERADGSRTWLRENDELTGENVLPGFSCRVGSLFPAPPAAIPA